MRGIRFSMLVAMPFILGAFYMAYQIFFIKNEDYLYWLLGFMVILIGIYFASGEINYWYNKKYPPHLDPPILAWLERLFPYYHTLKKDDQEKFRNRLALYLDGRSFHLMLKEKKKIPEDFKAIIAAHAIQMTMGMKDFLIGDYDRIICYNHPFPSPQFKFLHTVETHKEDGVILISFEQLVQAFGKKEKNYNIAFHAYAEALLSLNPDWNNLESDVETWIKLNAIFPYSKDVIHAITGFEELDRNTVSFAAFFMYNDKFKMIWPDQFDHYSQAINYESTML